MSIEELTVFLGWITAINFAILIFSTVMIILLKKPVVSFHAKLFSLKEEDVSRMHFQYLGQFKALVIVFNLVPYLVLRLVF